MTLIAHHVLVLTVCSLLVSCRCSCSFQWAQSAAGGQRRTAAAVRRPLHCLCVGAAGPHTQLHTGQVGGCSWLPGGARTGYVRAEGCCLGPDMTQSAWLASGLGGGRW